MLREITNDEMPLVVIDATGNLKAINNGFEYLAHGGRYVLVGLQKKEISFLHPLFHKKETTLMSSRNATREDFQFVIQALRSKQINANAFITHRLPFQNVMKDFPGFLDPASGVIKAMIEM